MRGVLAACLVVVVGCGGDAFDADGGGAADSGAAGDAPAPPEHDAQAAPDAPEDDAPALPEASADATDAGALDAADAEPDSSPRDSGAPRDAHAGDAHDASPADTGAPDSGALDSGADAPGDAGVWLDAATVDASPAINLLRDPGFEDAVFDEWGIVYEPTSSSVFSYGPVTDAARTGAYSTKLLVKDLGDGVYQNVNAPPLVSGHTYTASAWVLTSAPALVTLAVRAWCWADDGGVSEADYALATVTASPAAWSQLAQSFSVPACNLRNAWFEVVGIDTGVFLYVDDVSFSP